MMVTGNARLWTASLLLLSAGAVCCSNALSREESEFLRRFHAIEKGMSATEALRIIGRRGEMVDRSSTNFDCSRVEAAVRQMDYSFTTYHTAHSGLTTVYHVCLDGQDRVLATPMTLINFD